MFRTALFAALLLTTLTVNAQAQQTFYIEVQNVVHKSDITPQVDVYSTKKFNDSLGIFAWLLIGQQWSEGLVGVMYTPKNWLELGLGYGLEHDENPGRYVGQIVLVHGPASLAIIGENGGSGSWYKIEGLVDLRRNFSLGIIGQRFVGLGPELQF